MKKSLRKQAKLDRTSHYWSHYTLITAVYAVAVAIGIFYFSLAKPDTFIVIGITTLLAIFPVFFMHTEYGVLALIIVRPIIDTFSGYSIITIQNTTLKMNAVLGIAVIVWGVFIVIKEEINLTKIPGLGI
ncbi:MAG: hypothetical protein Q8P90_00810, partial [bacterium]|nr:hypothetical protein [bacterium]